MGKLTDKPPLSGIRSFHPLCRDVVGLLLAGLIIFSCSGHPVKSDRARGIYHRVKTGETLSSIARAYHVDLQELAEINNISSPDRIDLDSVIFIPDATQIVDDVMTAARPLPPPSVPETVQEPAKPPPIAVKTEPPVKRPEPPPTPEKRPAPPPAEAKVKERAVPPTAAEKEAVLPRAAVKQDAEKAADQPVVPREKTGKQEQIQFDKKRFVWPVKGKVVSRFGIQPDRTNNNGIRISASEGTAVQATADGLVIFSAPLKDYGETIIIRHDDQYATVYSHLGVRTVQGETKVKKGDRIAFLGKGENQEESYLHFEIRHRNKARNPLFFLP